MLGFPTAASAPMVSTFGSVPSGFAYDDVACSGNEVLLDNCPHLNTHNCGPGEGAGVVCDINRVWLQI